MGTGLDQLTTGQCYIDGKSIVTDLEAARRDMSLCFQFDAVNSWLTAREHLRLFAKIRGVPIELREELINYYIDKVGLGTKKNNLAGKFSGGNRRKLSVALSLISSPSVLFLDEPTTGIDIAIKRKILKFIQKVSKKRAIILTTHSMEDAAALSNKIAIMVKGAIRTYGTPQELKAKEGDVLSVVCRIDPGVGVVEKILKTLKSLSPSTVLEHFDESNTDELQLLATCSFKVSSKETSMSHIFDQLNQLKKSNDLIDFSVSQLSLEDIFIRLAELQDEQD